jgi:hypothetical protein
MGAGWVWHSCRCTLVDGIQTVLIAMTMEQAIQLALGE